MLLDMIPKPEVKPEILDNLTITLNQKYTQNATATKLSDSTVYSATFHTPNFPRVLTVIELGMEGVSIFQRPNPQKPILSQVIYEGNENTYLESIQINWTIHWEVKP